MPTPKFRQRHKREFTNGRWDWKDHPLVVAPVAAAGTAVFFMTVVVPLRVDLLTNDNKRLTDLAANAIQTADQLERTQRLLADARAAILRATGKTLFGGQSVYPIGFEHTVIGTPVDEFVKRAGAGKWAKGGEYFSTNLYLASQIISATYHFDGKGEARRVRLIVFQMNEDAVALTRAHLTTTFGEPQHNEGSDSIWAATGREIVLLQLGFYHVYPANDPMAKARIELSKK